MEESQFSETRVRELLNTAMVGRLSMSGEDNLPYCLPFSYAIEDDYIYLHCGPGGRKIEILKLNSLVCFEVDQFDLENLKWGFSALIESKAELVDDREEKVKAFSAMRKKYPVLCSDFTNKVDRESYRIIRIQIGKVSASLVLDGFIRGNFEFIW